MELDRFGAVKLAEPVEERKRPPRPLLSWSAWIGERAIRLIPADLLAAMNGHYLNDVALWSFVHGMISGDGHHTSAFGD